MHPDEFSILKKTLLATKKFNPAFVKKFGIDEIDFYNKRNDILQGYEDEKNKSCERGTKIHSEFENSFYKEGQQSLENFGIGGKFTCKKDYYELDLPKGIYPEYLISKISGDGILKIAGQIDLLIKDRNDIYIVDWKTNKEIKQKSYYNKNKKTYECMRFPLNNIMDANYWHYTLQLSLYAYLLQQINPDFNIKMLKLVHIDHEGKRTDYELEYMKNEVELMLKHYKKQLKIEQELDKIKPVKWVM